MKDNQVDPVVQQAEGERCKLECNSIRAKTWDRLKKYFRRKIGVFTQSKARLCKHLIVTLVFEQTPIFFAEN
jgi:hypothetical protein